MLPHGLTDWSLVLLVREHIARQQDSQTENESFVDQHVVAIVVVVALALKLDHNCEK